MSFFLNENKVDIHYITQFREYSIGIPNTSGRQDVHFCPWCGSKLPISLRDIWFDELEEKIEDFDGFDDQRIPDEYRDGRWWKGRF